MTACDDGCAPSERGIEVEPRNVGNTSLTLGLRVRRDEALLVEGELRYVFVDARSRTKRPMPDEVRGALERREV